MTRRRFLVAVISLSVLAMLLLNAERMQKAILYAAGDFAGRIGNLPEAFSIYQLLYQIDPEYRDIAERLEQTATLVALRIPGSLSLDQELKLVRWLASQNDQIQLAELLDRCVVRIPAGEFSMGNDDGDPQERPRHLVYLDSFELDRYEVTNAQYRRFLRESGIPPPRYWSGLNYPAGMADSPVVGVSWTNARAYCAWAGKRLPTEAEWEKACRGPSGNLYPWGDDWDPNKTNVGYSQIDQWPLRLDDGWELLLFNAAGLDTPNLQPVGRYPQGASYYGILDLSGNASEWVEDWYNWNGYWDMPATNPVNTGPPWNHVVRGSGWFDRRGQEHLIEALSRCPTRNSSHSFDDPRIGFRCARSIQ